MARITNLTNFLTDVADAIRSKTGKTDTIPCSNFDTEIESITGGTTPTGEIAITSNGTYDVTDYASANVDVPSGEVPTIGFVVDEWNDDGYPTKVTVVGMTEIPNYYFQGSNAAATTELLHYVTDIVLPETITTLGKGAFITMYRLSNINIPDGITDIPQECFYGCTTISTLTVPSSITSIGTSSFRTCTKLSVLSFSQNNISQLGEHAFRSCSALSTVDFSNSSFTDIPQYCFGDCSALSTVVLPSTVTNISKYAFYRDSRLSTINFPDGLLTIGDSAFYSCDRLILSTLPSSLTTINSAAFYDCTGLEKISMSNVNTIAGASASYGSFSKCTNLKQVWIGSAITSSGFARYSFVNCTSLETMYIDLPRATVEAFTYYSYAFMNDTTKTGIIICNDDDGFITKDEFDALEVS